MVAQLRGGYTHGRPLLLAGQHALKTELQRILRLVKQLSLTHTVTSPTHAMTSTNTPLDAIHIGRYQVLPRTDRIQDVDTRTVHRYTCVRTIYIIDSGGDMSNIREFNARIAQYDDSIKVLVEGIHRLENLERAITPSYALFRDISHREGYEKIGDSTIRGTMERLLERLQETVKALQEAREIDHDDFEANTWKPVLNSLRTPTMPVSLRTGDRKWTY